MKQITVENKQEIKKTYATSLRRAINSAIRRHSGHLCDTKEVELRE